RLRGDQSALWMREASKAPLWKEHNIRSLRSRALISGPQVSHYFAVRTLPCVRVLCLVGLCVLYRRSAKLCGPHPVLGDKVACVVLRIACRRCGIDVELCTQRMSSVTTIATRSDGSAQRRAEPSRRGFVRVVWCAWCSGW